jgi:ArsR family transcriptional regulator
MRFNPSVGRRMTACAISLDDPSSQLLPVELDDLDALFKGFADPTRLRVLNALAAGELCVCDLVELLGIAQPAVSRHLAYLRRMRLVEATREWKFAHYRLAEPSNAVHRNLIACVRRCFTGVPSLDAERAAAVVRVRERAQVPC